jgi:hypothetical protein
MSGQWSKKFLAKTNRYGFKDDLVGKLFISKANEDEASDIGTKMSISTKMNGIAYIELTLSTDVKTCSVKIKFNNDNGCKIDDYPYGHAASAWEKPKNNYEPMSAPSALC